MENPPTQNEISRSSTSLSRSSSGASDIINSYGVKTQRAQLVRNNSEQDRRDKFRRWLGWSVIVSILVVTVVGVVLAVVLRNGGNDKQESDGAVSGYSEVASDPLITVDPEWTLVEYKNYSAFEHLDLFLKISN